MKRLLMAAMAAFFYAVPALAQLPVSGLTENARNDPNNWSRTNEALRWGELAGHGSVSFTITGNRTLTAVENGNGVIALIGSPGAGATITFPDGDRKRVVINGTGQDMTLDTVGVSTLKPVLKDGEAVVIVQDDDQLTVVGGVLDLANLPTGVIDGGNDWCLFADASDNDLLKKVLCDNLPGSGGGAGSAAPVSTGKTFIGAVLAKSVDQVTADTAVPEMVWATAVKDSGSDPNDSESPRFWGGPDQAFVGGDVNTGSDEITETAHGYRTAMGPYEVDCTSCPAPLTDGQDVYIIKVDANTYKLATTTVDALAGTAIDLTTAGTGATLLGETRFFVPPGVTLVEVACKIYFEEVATDPPTSRVVAIQKNGASFPGRGGLRRANQIANNMSYPGHSAAVVVDGDTDYFTCVTQQLSGGNLTAKADDRTWFYIKVLDNGGEQVGLVGYTRVKRVTSGFTACKQHSDANRL